MVRQGKKNGPQFFGFGTLSRFSGEQSLLSIEIASRQPPDQKKMKRFHYKGSQLRSLALYRISSYFPDDPG
jgi:hypothetical protein